MKKMVYFTIGSIAVLALAFGLNPSAERHREKIDDAISERNQLAGALGIGAFTAFVSTYHSLGVASYTTVNERTLSAGAFGLVVVFE